MLLPDRMWWEGLESAPWLFPTSSICSLRHMLRGMKWRKGGNREETGQPRSVKILMWSTGVKENINENCWLKECIFIMWTDHVFKFSIIAKTGFKIFPSLPFKSNPLHNKHTVIHLQWDTVENFCPDLNQYHWYNLHYSQRCWLETQNTISQPKSQEWEWGLLVYRKTSGLHRRDCSFIAKVN